MIRRASRQGGGDDDRNEIDEEVQKRSWRNKEWLEKKGRETHGPKFASTQVPKELQKRNWRYEEWLEKKDRRRGNPKTVKILEHPRWRRLPTHSSIPPPDMMITSSEQKNALLRSRATWPVYGEESESSDWLSSNGVKAVKLEFEDLLSQCVITQTTDVATNVVVRHISISEIQLSEFESQLNFLIEAIVHRIHSLLIGSKRLFGLVKGRRLAVVVDASDGNLGFGRLQPFQESLQHLLEEQLAEKAHLFIATYGTNASCLWPKVRQVDGTIIDESRLWISSLKPSGGANLLSALKAIGARITEFDAVLAVIGSPPDQSADIVVDYFLQSSAGRTLPVHAVSFDSTSDVVPLFCQELAQSTGGRFHCFSPIREEAIFESTDIALLLDEIRTASDILSKTSRLRSGNYDGAFVTIEVPGAKQATNQDAVRSLPRPPGHDGPLRVQTPSFQARTSVDWLREHGLRAKGLNLYQVLSGDAYAPIEKFVPSIQKSVKSCVNAAAMTQFTWHDGSTKNIHVNLPAVHDYQKKLEAAVLLYKRRMDWLSSGSRSIAGTLAEPTILILIDISAANLNYAIHIQHALRLILEQQMGNKKTFNLIAFGGRPIFWQPDFVPVNDDTLQSAWTWILGLVFEGSRNTLAGLRMAMENRFFQGSFNDCGIYLLTTGIPDQDSELISCYLSECCLGRRLVVHAIYLNVDEFDCGGVVPARFATVEDTAHALRDIAHSTGGRFHWFKGSAAIESDDMKLISGEIEKAINFGTKASIIVDSVKNRPRKPGKSAVPQKKEDSPQRSFKATPVPSFVRRRNSVAPSLATLSASLPSSPSSALSLRSQRPLSATSPRQSKSTHSKRPASGKIARSSSANSAILARFAFKVGGTSAKIPAEEEVMSTKAWLKRYSLKKLKIDLPHIFHGLDCHHDDLYVRTLGRRVSARFCSIFPVVNVEGSIKHLQLTRKELDTYEEELSLVLSRYVKRIAWLMSKSHRIFGVATEKRVVVLVDTSGSMVQNLPDLKRDLTSLIWDQFHAHSIAFNFISFSSDVRRWKPEVVQPSHQNCHDAIAWVEALRAEGGTPTLTALSMALPAVVEERSGRGIYLVTDGKPDTSMTKVLSEVSRLNPKKTGVPSAAIHAISFNCDDDEANSFLRMLAKDNRGRFHWSFTIENTEIDLWCFKILEDGFKSGESALRMPDAIFKSDDLALLGREIQIGRRFLEQSRSFSHLLENAALPHDKHGHDSTTKLLHTKTNRSNKES